MAALGSVRPNRPRAPSGACSTTVSLGLALLLALPARAQDQFVGTDKALHFTASALIAAGGYGLATWQHEPTADRLALGAGLALTAGVAKELWDISGHGEASMNDLAWDAIGTAAGLLVTWLVDRAIARW